MSQSEITVEMVDATAGGAEEMNERPMIFSTPMVRAIIDGKKTVTRRVIKNRGAPPKCRGPSWSESDPAGWGWQPCAQGGLIWVREAWAYYNKSLVIYRADGDGYNVKWRPSIHMPKTAASIWLRVTDIRAERLHDITEADAEREGVEPILVPPDGGSSPHIEGFIKLWDTLNAKRGYGWDQNPWVCRIEFERMTHRGS